MILAAPAFVVFEGWAFLLMAAADFKLRDISGASERQNL
jgi:hypothetical protein